MSDQLNGLLLVLDGIESRHFNELIAKGDMPNISRHLIERSPFDIEKVVCCHPSSTYENMQAINTGCYPYDPGATYFSSHSLSMVNLLGFDNTSKGNCAKKKTIFHNIPDSAISIHNPWNDGADDKHPNIYSLSSLHYLKLSEGSNAAAVSRFIRALDNRKPKFTEIWFPAYDGFAHKKPSEKLKNKYIKFDKYLGKIIDALRTHGFYDNTIIVLTSDHGMQPATKHIDHHDLFTKSGLSLNHNDYPRFFAYGYSVGQLYLNSTKKSELQNIIDKLISNDCIEHIVQKITDNERIAYSKQATVKIIKNNNKYCMQIISGSNPFDYSNELCEKLSILHTSEESLELTYNEEQPDAVVGIANSLSHPDSPDLRLLTAPGYDFGKVRNGTQHPLFLPKRVRAHGSLHVFIC